MVLTTATQEPCVIDDQLEPSQVANNGQLFPYTDRRQPSNAKDHTDRSLVEWQRLIIDRGSTRHPWVIRKLIEILICCRLLSLIDFRNLCGNWVAFNDNMSDFARNSIESSGNGSYGFNALKKPLSPSLNHKSLFAGLYTVSAVRVKHASSTHPDNLWLFTKEGSHSLQCRW